MESANERALPPIDKLSRDSFAFFTVPQQPIGGMQVHRTMRGVRGRDGHIFLHRGMNEFDEIETQVPAEAMPMPVPSDEWLSTFFWDPAKHRLVADPNAMPLNAQGTPFAILDNGGTPFVVYARDDSASIFSQPPDGYLGEGFTSLPLYFALLLSLCRLQI